MPIPKPESGEQEKDFMSRCMSALHDEFPDQEQCAAVCYKSFRGEDKNMSDTNTYDLNDVEIFETGNHKGDEYTESDLDDMVTCFNETKNRLKPYLKLGHDYKQVLLQQDGMPAAGWITGLKRNGSKLLADIKSVPSKIKDLIDRKAYGRISSEIFWNGKIDNKDYRRGIKAVALLGGDTPAVQTLNDFINLYTDDNINFETLKIYDDEDSEMERSLEILQEQIKEYSDKLADKDKKEVQFIMKITELEKERDTLKAKIDADEKATKANEIKMYIDAQVKDGKILPAQVKVYTDMAMRDFESVKNLVKDMPKLVDLFEESRHVEIPKGGIKKYSEMDAQEKEDYIDSEVKKYSEEKKISYKEAYLEFMANFKEE